MVACPEGNGFLPAAERASLLAKLAARHRSVDCAISSGSGVFVMQKLQDKTAVVTGAASGLGLAMAKAFCQEGMRVVLADLPGPALAEATRSLGDQGFAVLAVAVDVADSASVDALARCSIEHFGRVDVLCNNAGIAGDLPRESWEHDLANWRRVLDVNLMGVIHGIHSFIPLMLGQAGGGHVINTASMGGLVALPYLAPYAAA